MAKSKLPAKTAALTVKRLALADLKPHPRNPRRHPESGSPQWAALKTSLEHDYYDPLVWNVRNGMLVSGHLRTKVLKESGFTEADCVVVDYDEQTHIARMISANKGAGEDDYPSLKDLLQEIDTGELDMALSGFTEEMLSSMMCETHHEQDQPPSQSDEKTAKKCPECGYEFPIR